MIPAELPSGTVTFLFTDIEGSTALWERNPLAMREAVERHLALLDRAVSDHGGVRFKTVGDAIQVAFATTAAALADRTPPHAWFVSFAPAETPRVAVAVVIEDGGGQPEVSGNRLAAPIAREVMEAVLGPAR